MRTFNKATLSSEVLEEIRSNVKELMLAAGCEVFNTPTPSIKFYTFEMAVEEAIAENVPLTMEQMKEHYKLMEGGFDAKNNILCLKADTVIEESLIFHEMVHTFQNQAVLIEACKDVSDPVRLNTSFEAEAYGLQFLWELQNTKLVTKSDEPYKALMNFYNTTVKPAVANFIQTK